MSEEKVAESDYTKSVRSNKVHPFSGVTHVEMKTIFSSKNIDLDLGMLGFLQPSVTKSKFMQINMIRDLPITLYHKKLVREKVANVVPLSNKGNAYLMWKDRQHKMWAKTKMSLKEAGLRLELWRSPIKQIDGHFGSGVVSYFNFLKTLFKMNAIIAFLWLAFVIIPGAVFNSVATTSTQTTTLTSNSTSSSCESVGTSRLQLSTNCSQQYLTYIYNVTGYSNGTTHLEALAYVGDFIEGSGWMENTVLFQGFYSSNELSISFLSTIASSISTYNLPLAYILVTGIYMMASLIFLAQGSASSIKRNLLKNEGQQNHYSELLFCSWSYGLTSESNAQLKHKTIRRDAVSLLAEQRDKERRKRMSASKKCCLNFLRFIINVLVLGLLCASGYLIYFITAYTTQIKSSYSGSVKLIISYAPSLTLTALNTILPIIFTVMEKGEDFNPALKLKISLIRTIFVRLAGLAVLVTTLYFQVTCVADYDTETNSCGVLASTQGSCAPLYCWESYVGQQLYRLVLMQFFVLVGTTFLVDFPRKLIVTRCACKLSNVIGCPVFNISAHVLELVYLQTLCWLGAFFSPLIPVMVFVYQFVLFYLKKLSLLMNYKPNEDSYRASDANTFFVVVLLMSFTLSSLPLSYIIITIPPSKGCGPFRVNSIIYDVVTLTMCDWPSGFLKCLDFVTSANFVVPLLVVLGVGIYYQTIMASAQKEKVNELFKQLHEETEEKKALSKVLGGRTPRPIAGNDSSPVVITTNNSQLSAIDEMAS